MRGRKKAVIIYSIVDIRREYKNLIQYVKNPILSFPDSMLK